ncbi:MAG: 23S rRNA (guanosine(2251)-2'-O)-methyltransferase RlmB, partial [Metamycoplasmataceae bacterium]
VKIISKEEMNEMTDLNHQGYIAILNEFKYYNLEVIFKDKPKIILILDHLEDPQNFGSILRSANASGIRHIIIPNIRSVDVNETVFKVSSGGIVGMKIIKVNSLQATVTKLKKEMFWIYATSLEQGASDYSTINYNFPLALIVGNEGKGISRSLLKEADQNIFIKMEGTVQSLNVAVATGIFLFYLKNRKEE